MNCVLQKHDGDFVEKKAYCINQFQSCLFSIHRFCMYELPHEGNGADDDKTKIEE